MYMAVMGSFLNRNLRPLLALYCSLCSREAGEFPPLFLYVVVETSGLLVDLSWSFFLWVRQINPRHSHSPLELRTVEPSDFRRILEMFFLIIHQFNTNKIERDSSHSTEKFRLLILEESVTVSILDISGILI